jgi:hypothetical protein
LHKLLFIRDRMIFPHAQQIYNKLNTTKQNKLKNDLIEAAFIYARIRAGWYLMDDEERKVNDEARTRAHDAFIDCCNILSREMNKAGEDADWRLFLGTDRKEIGDFACYLHCIIGLNGR